MELIAVVALINYYYSTTKMSFKLMQFEFVSDPKMTEVI